MTVGHDLWVGYSGVFVANELGYFKDAGLDVKLKPFSNPGDTLPALVSDQLDIGLTTLQNLAVLNGNSDTDVAAIALVDSSNGADAIVAKKSIASRSEEHTSELQSHSDIVCRLLLETKKQVAMSVH